MRLQDFKNYMGDVNLEYGGTFFDFSEWKYDYVPALRITDLDSACGFTGAVMVERITIVLRDDLDTIQSVIDSCDMRQRHVPYNQSEQLDPHFVRAMLHSDPSTSTKMEIAYCFMSYGLYDPDDGAHFYNDDNFPQGSHAYSHNNMIIIQTNPGNDWDAPMSYDGWKADIQLAEDTTLFGYLLENGYLSEYE